MTPKHSNKEEPTQPIEQSPETPVERTAPTSTGSVPIITVPDKEKYGLTTGTKVFIGAAAALAALVLVFYITFITVNLNHARADNVDLRQRNNTLLQNYTNLTKEFEQKTGEKPEAPTPAEVNRSAGPQGAQGAAGATGAAGAQGIAGAPGAPGTRGSAGEAGRNGAAGANGENGTAGANGANGRDGLPGAQGAAGANGQDGATGATGPQGPQGERGEKGETGATGAQGPQGETGPAGAPGAPCPNTAVVQVPEANALGIVTGYNPVTVCVP